MPSFFDKIKGGVSGNDTHKTSSSKKNGPPEPQPNWLQKLSNDPQPVLADGSDKFFGAENYGNTCYLNSILQCLYYSVPFRELVVNYPRRTPLEKVTHDPNGKPRLNTNLLHPGHDSGMSPSKAKSTSGPASARNAGVAATNQKPEDKDSPEYKKKQALMTGPVLALDYDNSATYGMKPSLFTGLKDVFEAMIASRVRTGVVSPKLFLEMLRKENDMFSGISHQDAHEFLNLLLNAVVDNIEDHRKQLKEEAETNGLATNGLENLGGITPGTDAEDSMSSRVQGIFQGTLTNETKCLTCENVSQRDEPFLDLSVDLEQHSSVSSCLNRFSGEEMLCEKNKFFCDHCGGLQEAEKRMKIKQAPKILALHLKRFKFTDDFQRLQKLFHRVVYPYHLRLFNTTDDAEDPDRIYELYAVVVHIGSGPYYGHYICIIKTPDRGWLLFDDENVEPVDKEYVTKFFGAQIGMACAYVLFYQETTEEAVKKEQDSEAAARAAASSTTSTAVATNGKDSHGLGISTILRNSNGNPASPVSPADDDPHLAALAHAKSAPVSASSPMTPGDMSAHATPNTLFSFANTPLTPHNTAGHSTHAHAHAPIQVPKKPDAAAKKQAAKEEKERKHAEKEKEKAERAAEKEREKELKARRRSLDQRNRERSRAEAAAVRRSLIMRPNGHAEPIRVPAPATPSSPTAPGFSEKHGSPKVNGTANGHAMSARAMAEEISPVVGASPTAVMAATTIPSVNQQPPTALASNPRPLPAQNASRHTSSLSQSLSNYATVNSLVHPPSSAHVQPHLPSLPLLPHQPNQHPPSQHRHNPHHHHNEPQPHLSSSVPTSSPHLSLRPSATAPTQPPPTPQHIHSSSFSGGLNRFRASSKSLSRKPKFLGSGKENAKDMPRPPTAGDSYAVEDHPDEAADVVHEGEPRVAKAEGQKALGIGNGEGTTKKRGFSLRKKASSLLS